MPNFTPQQGILNKAWRQGSGQGSGAWKPSGKSTSANKPRSNSSRTRTPRTGNTRAQGNAKRNPTPKKRKTGSRTQRSGRTRAQGSRVRANKTPSSAQNVSRFGKGVKGRFNPTLTQAKQVATNAGVRGAKLGTALANSKFLAGAGSLPGIALITGNLFIWGSNIQQLRNIYRGGTNATITILPRTSQTVEPELSPYRPFEEGGGTPGVAYGIPYAHAKFENGEVLPAHEPFNNYYVTAHAPLPKIGLWVNGVETELTAHWSTGGRGIEPIFSRTINGTYFPIVDGVLVSRRFRSAGLYLFGWERIDGEPDLDDRPDMEEASTIIGGAPNSAIPQSNPSEIVTPSAGGFKPSGQSAIRGVSGGSGNSNTIPVEPFPTIPKPAEIPATANTPAVLNSPLPNNTPEAKPKPAKPPGLTRLIPAAAIGATAPPSGSGQIKTTNFPTAPKTPRINPCNKGCSGSTSGGNASATLNNGVAIAGLANDLLNQNQILNQINSKLGAQIPNGGLAGAATKLTQSLAVDRWLNLLNTALLLHNGFYLSSAVLDTTTQIVDNLLQTGGFEFTSPDGSEIPFSNVVSSTVRGFFTRAFGESAVNTATNIFVKSNRFIQSTANLLSSVRNIADGGMDIMEQVGENVSLIGNALKRSGGVRENSYPWMPERFDNNSRMINRLEKLGDKADTIENITSDVQNVAEDIKDLQQNKDDFANAAQAARELLTTDQTTLKTTAVDFPAPTEEDERRGLEDG